jgi:hypothetical protein
MVTRFAQSGLTEEAFCEGEGVSAKLFHRWRVKRIKGAARAVVVDKPVRVTPGPVSAGGFVDLGPLKTGDAKLEMRLDLGGGVQLHVVRG